MSSQLADTAENLSVDGQQRRLPHLPLPSPQGFTTQVTHFLAGRESSTLGLTNQQA